MTKKRQPTLQITCSAEFKQDVEDLARAFGSSDTANFLRGIVEEYIELNREQIERYREVINSAKMIRPGQTKRQKADKKKKTTPPSKTAAPMDTAIPTQQTSMKEVLETTAEQAERLQKSQTFLVKVANTASVEGSGAS